MTHFPPVVFAVACAALVIALTALARRLPVPSPILQVGAGVLIGLVRCPRKCAGGTGAQRGTARGSRDCHASGVGADRDYLPRKLSAEIRRKDPMPNPKGMMLVAWTSMRGGALVRVGSPVRCGYAFVSIVHHAPHPFSHAPYACRPRCFAFQ